MVQQVSKIMFRRKDVYLSIISQATRGLFKINSYSCRLASRVSVVYYMGKQPSFRFLFAYILNINKI